jgi:hypothetical protein
MRVVLGLLLFVLGALAARDVVGEKVPPAKKILDSMKPSEEYIGLAGVFVGMIWFLEAINLLRYFDSEPLHVLETWVASSLAMSTGLVLSMVLLAKIVGDPPPSIFAKINALGESLKPYKKYLGLGAIVMGLIYPL